MDNQQDGRYSQSGSIGSSEDTDQSANQQNKNQQSTDQLITEQQDTMGQSTDSATGNAYQTTTEQNVYQGAQTDNLNINGEAGNKTGQTGILDIVYGILFDPVRTFASFAENPPLKTILIIFIALHLAEALAYLFYMPSYIDKMNFSSMMMPPGFTYSNEYSFVWINLAIMTFVFNFIKWFYVSGALHLLADLFGGRGKVRSVAAVCGAAGLPSVFMIPVTIILLLIASPGVFLTVFWLTGIALYVWSVSLVVIGLREVHHLSTGRSLAIVVMPWVVMTCLFVLYLLVIGFTSVLFMQDF